MQQLALSTWLCRCFPAIFFSLLVVAASNLADAKTQEAPNKGYWRTVDRKLATTSLGNVAPIVAHNCYSYKGEDSRQSLKGTIDKIVRAQSQLADILEFDIRGDGDKIVVSHEDDGATNCATLLDVLTHESVAQGDQILYIEIKETKPSQKFAKNVVETFIKAGLPKKGRPVVFRAMDKNRRGILVIQSVLKQQAYAELAKYVRFHELISGKGESGVRNVQSRINNAKKSGFDGIELRYDSRNLFANMGYAKSLDLGVGVYTVPSHFGEVFVAALREDVDSIVTDLPATFARQKVEEDNVLAYLNTFGLPDEAKGFYYMNKSGKSVAVRLGGARAPSLKEAKKGSAMFGSSLLFTGNQSVTLADADNESNAGVLIAANVMLGQVKIPNETSRCIVAKSDNSGFVLEQHNLPGRVGTVLRFGINIDGQYHWARVATKRFDPNESYFIVGAYDGNGRVTLFVNGSDRYVLTSTAIGGVSLNDTPLVLGADPQGLTDRRHFFQGAIQQVQVLSWKDPQIKD